MAIKQPYVKNKQPETTYQVSGIGVFNETDLKTFLDSFGLTGDKVSEVVQKAFKSGFSSFYDTRQHKSTKIMKLKFAWFFYLNN